MLPLVVWISAMARTSLKFKGVLVPAFHSLSSSNTRKLFKSVCCPKRKKLVHTSSMSFAEKGDILRNQLTFDKTDNFTSLKGYTDAVFRGQLSVCAFTITRWFKSV